MRVIELYEENPFQDLSEDREYLDFAAEVLGGEADDGDRPEAEPEYVPGSKFLSAEDMVSMAAEPDAPLSEDEQIKAELLWQSDLEHFGTTDTRTDDKMMSAYRRVLGEDDDG